MHRNTRRIDARDREATEEAARGPVRLKRRSSIQWVPLDAMYVRTGVAQRAFRREWGTFLAKNFDPDSFMRPVVNRVGDRFWIIDGQHRTYAYKAWLGEWAGQKIECEVYHDLTEKEEAALFDHINSVKAVRAFDRFNIRLTAEYEEETEIAQIVRNVGLKIADSGAEGSVSCVSTLAKVYRRGSDCLSRGLHIANESFGDEGLESDILDGLGLLVSRYNGKLDDRRAIATLSTIRGGVNTLRSRAERLRQQTGVTRSQCIAGAAVEIINRGKGGKKLPGWFKAEQ